MRVIPVVKMRVIPIVKMRVILIVKMAIVRKIKQILSIAANPWVKIMCFKEETTMS